MGHLAKACLSSVQNKFDKEKLEVAEQEKKGISCLLLGLCAVDVAEIFSPRRFVELAGQFGLKPGVALDLCEKRPWNDEYWDLDKPPDVAEFERVEGKFLYNKKPITEVIYSMSNKEWSSVKEKYEITAFKECF